MTESRCRDSFELFGYHKHPHLSYSKASYSLFILGRSGSSFPLGVEVDSSNRRSEVENLCEMFSIKMLSTSRSLNCLPPLLLEQHEHVPVNPQCWSRALITHYFLPCY